MTLSELCPDERFRELVTSACQCEGALSFMPCPSCAGYFIEYPVPKEDIEREARCTNCSIVYRGQWVDADEIEGQVEPLPFKGNWSNMNLQTEKIVVFNAWAEQGREVPE